MINITTPSELTKIYLVTNCYGDPNKVYIGKTKVSREYKHIKTYGKDIIYDYIDEINSLDPKDWEPLETFWINYFRFLGFEIMNVRKKGGSGPSFATQETKDKISNANKGVSRNKGVPQSEEHRSKLGKTRKGRKHLRSSVELRRIQLLGRKQSQEEKDKRAVAISKPILQYDLEGNFIKEWDSATKCSIELNLLLRPITACIRGNTKASYNFQWKLKTDNYPLNIGVYIRKRTKKN